jgi:hypothetical protein
LLTQTTTKKKKTNIIVIGVRGSRTEWRMKPIVLGLVEGFILQEIVFISPVF